jgi:serine/threonine protein kinase
MTPEAERPSSVPPRDSLQPQYPGIRDEIEGAINTLRKLKQITDSDERLLSVPPLAPDVGQMATIAATADLASPAPGDTQLFGQTEAAPGVRREVPRLAASSSFGRYQIVRMLGKGAMGAVYLAYDTQLHRHVALKTPSLGESPEVIERFYREARAAAQLRNPYLCPVYDVGKVGAVTYLSMAFIDGESMSAAMAEGRLGTTGRVADVIRKVALGLQKAHDLGIIHRDLKPDNIMIDRDGEPIVMDFGLARRVDDLMVTLPGTVLGTPAFMSPEQVEGDARKIGPATDIYSLGVILYLLLAGRLPFQGSLTAVLRQIGDAHPARPSSFNEALGDDSPLEKICLKMMAKSAADRFASMAEVAEALGSLSPREERPIAKPSMWSRVKSWPATLRWTLSRPADSARFPAAASPRGAESDPNHPTQAGP